MELRRGREGDRGTLARLGALSFGNEVSSWEEYYDPGRNPRLDPRGVYVVEEDGGVRATATVLPLEVYVDGRAVEMGGVAAVNTHPAYRRRGYAGELMRLVLARMREEGRMLSVLWPFAHAFYRTYGWELAGESLSYRIGPTDLPTSEEQRRVRAYREEDLPRMMDLYAEEMARHPLAVVRGEAYWRWWMSRDGREAAIYERDAKIEGYILYEMTRWREEREPHRTLAVSELITRTPEARAGLISFLAAQDPLVFGVRMSTPRGEPLHPYLASSHIKVEVEPEFMLRLVDVEGALRLLDLAADPPLVLEVSDGGIPENAGSYTVGDGEISSGTEAEMRVSLDVRQLACLYAGYLPARELARHGLIRPNYPEALEVLDALFPVGDPYISEPDHF
ncbi:MAG: GNAT family N-acetyltransferase [Actinomycetota bacterium]